MAMVRRQGQFAPKQNSMKNMLLLGFLGMFLTTAIPQRALGANAGFDVQVVVAVRGLDDDGLARLAKVVAREPALTLEYSCVASGVLVLKYSDLPSGTRADAITTVRRTLASAGLDSGMEVLYVFAEATGPGKC